METTRTKKYKASISNTAPLALKTNLEVMDNTMLGISLGSKNSEGEQLRGCLDFLAKNFESGPYLLAMAYTI